MVNLLHDLIGNRDDTIEISIHVKSNQTGKEAALMVVNASPTIAGMFNMSLQQAQALGFKVHELLRGNPMLDEAIAFIEDQKAGGPCLEMSEFLDSAACGECTLAQTEGEYSEEDRGCWKHYFKLKAEKAAE